MWMGLPYKIIVKIFVHSIYGGMLAYEANCPFKLSLLSSSIFSSNSCNVFKSPISNWRLDSLNIQTPRRLRNFRISDFVPDLWYFEQCLMHLLEVFQIQTTKCLRVYLSCLLTFQSEISKSVCRSASCTKVKGQPLLWFYLPPSIISTVQDTYTLESFNRS